MNYPYIVAELLLALRGSRSSAELSKSAGYKFNQVNRWETGEKHLRWDEFCGYCHVLDIPLPQILSNIFHYDKPDPKEFLGHLYSLKFPFHSIAALAERLHRHPSAVRRYLDGEIYPDLEFVLAFMDLDATRLSNFISAILPSDSSSPLRTQFEKDVKVAISESQHPIAAAIEAWLKSLEYQKLEAHDDAFLADRAGCSPQTVQQTLSSMLKVGTVVQDEKLKFKPTYNTIDISGVSPKDLANLFKYWHERMVRFYSKGDFSHRGPVRTRGGVRIAPVSQKTSQQINEILLRTSSEIQMTLENGDDDFDDVRVIIWGSMSTLDC